MGKCFAKESARAFAPCLLVAAYSILVSKSCDERREWMGSFINGVREGVGVDNELTSYPKNALFRLEAVAHV